MADVDLKQVDKIRKKITELEDQAADDVERTVKNGLSAISDEIVIFVNGLKSNDQGVVDNSIENLRSVQEFTVALGPALEKIAEQSQNKVINRLSEITKLLNETIEAAGYVGITPRIDTDSLRALLEVDLRSFNGGAAATQQILTREMFNRVSGLSTMKDMVKELKAVVSGQRDRAGLPMERHARTWANTATTSYQNEFMQRALPEDSVGGWYYSGPDDRATRQFCDDHVGKVWGDEKIRADIATNPHGGQSIRAPGGWNCRHVLIPVPKSEVEAGEVEVIS